MMEAGRIDDFFDESDLDQCLKYFTAFKEKTEPGTGQTFTGINQQHPFYGWFHKLIFSKIQYKFGEDVQLLFAALLDSDLPLDVHSDYYHKRLGEPFMAFLIPLNVNGSKHGMDRASTIVFDQTDTYVDESDHRSKRSRPPAQYLDLPVLESNATHLSDSMLSHCDPRVLSRLSVKSIMDWQPNSLLFWDERLMHCSNDYKKNGVLKKQAIVIHSYKSINNDRGI
mgnify:CR=1 FL=1